MLSLLFLIASEAELNNPDTPIHRKLEIYRELPKELKENSEVVECMINSLIRLDSYKQGVEIYNTRSAAIQKDPRAIVDLLDKSISTKIGAWDALELYKLLPKTCQEESKVVEDMVDILLNKATACNVKLFLEQCPKSKFAKSRFSFVDTIYEAFPDKVKKDDRVIKALLDIVTKPKTELLEVLSIYKVLPNDLKEDFRFIAGLLYRLNPNIGAPQAFDIYESLPKEWKETKQIIKCMTDVLQKKDISAEPALKIYNALPDTIKKDFPIVQCMVEVLQRENIDADSALKIYNALPDAIKKDLPIAQCMVEVLQRKDINAYYALKIYNALNALPDAIKKDLAIVQCMAAILQRKDIHPEDALKIYNALSNDIKKDLPIAQCMVDILQRKDIDVEFALKIYNALNALPDAIKKDLPIAQCMVDILQRKDIKPGDTVKIYNALPDDLKKDRNIALYMTNVLQGENMNPLLILDIYNALSALPDDIKKDLPIAEYVTGVLQKEDTNPIHALKIYNALSDDVKRDPKIIKRVLNGIFIKGYFYELDLLEKFLRDLKLSDQIIVVEDISQKHIERLMASTARETFKQLIGEIMKEERLRFAPDMATPQCLTDLL